MRFLLTISRVYVIRHNDDNDKVNFEFVLKVIKDNNGSFMRSEDKDGVITIEYCAKHHEIKEIEKTLEGRVIW